MSDERKPQKVNDVRKYLTDLMDKNNNVVDELQKMGMIYMDNRKITNTELFKYQTKLYDMGNNILSLERDIKKTITLLHKIEMGLWDDGFIDVYNNKQIKNKEG